MDKNHKMRQKLKCPFDAFLVIFLLVCACSVQRENDIESIIDEYYVTYNKRQDLDRFMEFYDDRIVLEDIINGDRIEGKKALGDFFDWNNESFKMTNGNSLVVTDKIIQGNKGVVKGYFTRFQWQQSEFEPMHFTTILIFNEAQKIVKQIDWINYPATLIDYNERKNSNMWIE